MKVVMQLHGSQKESRLHFISIVAVGKRGSWRPAKAVSVTESTLRTTGPGPANSRQSTPSVRKSVIQ